MFVPSANKSFTPLLVAAKVNPDPEAVVNATVYAPYVPFETTYVFNISSGTVTVWFPVMVPVNLITS